MSSESKKSFLVTEERDRTLKMTSSTTSYLEQYLDSLENLPSELKKNFNKMHDLDTKNKDILVDIDSASDDYLRKVRDLSPAKRKGEMEKIQVSIIIIIICLFINLFTKSHPNQMQRLFACFAENIETLNIP